MTSPARIGRAPHDVLAPHGITAPYHRDEALTRSRDARLREPVVPRWPARTEDGDPIVITPKHVAYRRGCDRHRRRCIPGHGQRVASQVPNQHRCQAQITANAMVAPDHKSRGWPAGREPCADAEHSRAARAGLLGISRTRRNGRCTVSRHRCSVLCPSMPVSALTAYDVWRVAATRLARDRRSEDPGTFYRLSAPTARPGGAPELPHVC